MVNKRIAERFSEVVTRHGESPFWDDRNERLLVMDVLEGVVVALEMGGFTVRYKVPSRVATMIRRRKESGFVVATERGVSTTNEQLNDFRAVVNLNLNPGIRTNDGGCDPFGSLIVGTMAYNETPRRGAVYRVRPTGQVTEILSPVSISNGVQWSADGDRVFYIDTPTGRVDSFLVDRNDGSWYRRSPYIAIDPARGAPDGMAIDTEGGLWIALWGGGAVHHYDRDGILVEEILVPDITNVSACTFGGDDLSTLFITTSQMGVDPTLEPKAGAVFAAETLVRGQPPFEFGE